MFHVIKNVPAIQIRNLRISKYVTFAQRNSGPQVFEISGIGHGSTSATF